MAQTTGAHLQQYWSKHLPDGLVQGADRRLQHGGHQKIVVKVFFCDDCGSQLEEHQNITAAVPRRLNLSQVDWIDNIKI